MEPEIVTLIVGLAGMFATLFASALGSYFTAKARSSVLREALFIEQLALIKQIVFKQGRIKAFVSVLKDKGGPYEEQAREDLGRAIREFSELEEEGAAILPVELWSEVKTLQNIMVDVISAYDDHDEVSMESVQTLYAHTTKLALLSRAMLGIDELTVESLKLYSSEKRMKNLASLEVDYLKEIYSNANTSK